MLTDTHCHIYKEYYEDIDNLMKEIEKNGVNRVINNACSYLSCLEVLELSKKYNNMLSTLIAYKKELENLENKLSNFFPDEIEDE